MTETFKIINFHAENVKKLKVIDITPTDNTIVITGKNGAGKSSILDSIYWALGGTKNIQDKPIRTGQETAVIKLDIGKYVIERRFTDKDSYLHVTSSDGAKYPSPQKMLDEMLGGISFDPLEFSRMKPADQYETLKRLVKLDIDIDLIERQNKADYQSRTDVNRRVKELEVKTKGIEFPEDLPEKPVDTFALMNNLKDGEVKVQQVGKLETDITLTGQLIDQLEAKLIEARANKLHLEDLVRDIKVNTPTADQLSEISGKIANAGAVNAKIKDREIHRANLKSLGELNAQADKLTKVMEGRDADRDAAIAKADMPIKGLTFVEGAVYYDGVPFEQASSAQQLRVSTSIAMAMNPKLKVIRIKDGSLLDPEGMESIKAMAKDKDFQLWIETVYADEATAIVIEDGAVKGAAVLEPEKKDAA